MRFGFGEAVVSVFMLAALTVQPSCERAPSAGRQDGDGKAGPARTDQKITGLSQSEAVSAAKSILRREGLLYDKYDVTARRVEGGWTVTFVEVPGGPGRHIMVMMGADGTLIKILGGA